METNILLIASLFSEITPIFQDGKKEKLKERSMETITLSIASLFSSNKEPRFS